MHWFPATFFLLGGILTPMVCANEEVKHEAPPKAIESQVSDAEGRYVKITRIDISRLYSAGAIKTNMSIDLWITGMAQRGNRGFLVKIRQMSDVFDDSGKLLSTKQRRSQIAALGQEVRSRIIKSGNPIIKLQLDAPARDAKTLKEFRGKIEVTPYSEERIEFKNLRTLLGKSLVHEKLVGIDVVPKLRMESGDTDVLLQLRGSHDRVLQWTVADGQKLLRSFAGGGSERNTEQQREVYKTYEGELAKNCSLWIKVASPGETRIIDFEFGDVKLP